MYPKPASAMYICSPAAALGTLSVRTVSGRGMSGNMVSENATFEDVAREISKAAGKSIRVEPISREQMMGRAATHLSLASDYATEGMDRMLYYYDKR